MLDVMPLRQLRHKGSFFGSLYVSGNLPTYPSLSQHFALSEKYVLMLAKGRGRRAVSQERIMILQESVAPCKVIQDCLGAWNL